MPKLLTFVDKSNTILREVIPKVARFDDLQLHETIKDMCFSILPEQLGKANGAHRSAAGMAANQWGIKKRVFIFTPDGSDFGKKMQVMINPSYLPYLRTGEKVPATSRAYEGCFSVPLTTGLVTRYEAILARYADITGKQTEVIMQGWEARVFQHETDHLDGKLFDGALDNYAGPPCTNRVFFKTREEMDQFFRSDT